MRFIFFTKTRWNEPPRLRHQLAGLLAGAGHEVVFFEKPLLPAEGSREARVAWPRVTLARHRELLHHKLRVGSLVQATNAAFTAASIRRASRSLAISPDDVVVNFNYEYYFLRRIFPQNPLITVVNDEFITSAPRIAQPSLRRAQQRTCAMSDAVLTPSVALRDQLAEHCRPEIFLPWADADYSSPPASKDRNSLFYWGFIGRRIDYRLLEQLASRLLSEMPEVTLDFFGPTEDDCASEPVFTQYPNVRLRGSAQLSEIPLDRMMGSIIPYVSGVPDVDVIVMPNKAMQLLARGMPLVITGMPRFESAPFVRRLDSGDPVETLRGLRADFERLQDSMRQYLESNGAESRLTQFLAIVERARAVPR